MGPREKKKQAPSPRKQLSLDKFLKPSAKTGVKRPRDEPVEESQSPKKSRGTSTKKDVAVENKQMESATVINNNNNNNNNNNKKDKDKDASPKQKAVGSKKSPTLTEKKNDKKSPDTKKSIEKTSRKVVPKKEKITPTKVKKVEKEPYEEMDSEIIDDDLDAISEEDGNSTTHETAGGTLSEEDVTADSEEHEDSISDLMPRGENSALPSASLTNEADSRILTPSPSPSPKVPRKSFKCKVCDEWFPNRYFQRKHMLREHEDQQYECRVCSYNSHDPEKLKSHIIKMHVAKKERTESVTLDEAQYDLDELITKQTPRKVIMEDGVALGRDPSSKMRFICAICDRIYTSKYSLERHVRCHTGEKPYQCDVCNFTTSYREHMQRHMTSVHLIVHSSEPKNKYVPKKRKKTEEKNVSTDDIDEDVETEGQQDSSFESHNSSDTTSSSGKKRRNILRKRFECAACGLKATHKTDLIDHIRERHPNAHIESLENGDGSKVHLIVTANKKATASRRMVITCPNCFMIFHDTWKYKVHMRSHTGIKPFGCSLCEFRATSKMTVRDHVHRKHKDSPNPKILLRTVGIDGTVQHVELNFPQREFKCDLCDEVFKDNYHMKQHKKKTHMEALPFSCVECSHREWARANIIIHCLQSHPDKDLDGMILRNGKPFAVGPHKLPKCDVCNKVFSYQSQLYLHQRQHTGERSFACDICNYRTNHKPALQKHIEKHLSGPDSPRKSSRRKKDSKEPEDDVNFVDMEEAVPVKNEGDKKRKAKKENEKQKSSKNNTKAKKGKEKANEEAKAKADVTEAKGDK